MCVGVSRLRLPAATGGHRPTAPYRTPPLEALGSRFVVEATDAADAAQLGRLLGGLRPGPGAPDRPVAGTYTLQRAPAGGYPRLRLWAADELLVGTDQDGRAVAHLLWHLTRRAVEATDLVVLHAAAAELDGAAVLLPAAMESGKSTLVAGLVASGLGYLTDEAVGLNPETGALAAFPRPLALHAGSWPPLARMRPGVEDSALGAPGGVRLLPAEELGRLPAGRPATPALVVSPLYRPGAPTELVRLRPAQTLALLAEHAFNLGRTGGDGFRCLAALARSCPGYRLVAGDLEAATATVAGLLASRS